MGGTSAASYTLTSGYYQGEIYRTLFGIGELVGKWLNGVSDPTNYEVRGTWNPIVGLGSISGPTTFTAIPASPTPTRWELETTGSDAIYELFVEIRRIGNVTVLTSATITLETFGSP